MLIRLVATSTALALLLAACSGGGQNDDPVDVAACIVASSGEWELLDLGATAEDAPTIELGAAYTVNMRPEPGAAGFLVVDVPGIVTVFADQEGTLTGATATGATLTLPDGTLDRHCPESIPEYHVVPAPEGPLTLQLGPSFQASVWVLVAAGAPPT